MDFSAFLVPPMAKDKEKVELKPVDEEADSKVRLVRLHKDSAEEVAVELPTVRVGGTPFPEARLGVASRDEKKTRSNEPDVGALIEKDVESVEKEWEAPLRRKVPWGWVALVACAFAAGILWSLVEVNRSEGQREDLAAEARSILQKEQEADLEAGRTIASIEKSANDFFDSRSVEEMIRYVRHPERVRPLMEKYYSAKPPVANRVKEISSLDPLTIEDKAVFWMASCELETAGSRQVLVETASDGSAKVDWETFVCYQPMEWDAFAESRPPGYTGDFRVYVEKDNFYSHEFADSWRYTCYRLTALRSEQTLYGYVERNGTLAERLDSLIEKTGEGATPMILKLELPENTLSRQGVLIRKLVNPRWLFVEPPATEEP